MTQDLAYRPARELAKLVRSGAIGSVELTRHFIERIERFDNDINAVVVRTFERALEDAAAADAALARGEASGPLHGLPMTIKESYVMQDTPATWGIEAQRDNVADADGLAVSRFRAAGAHFLGKTNVPVDLADVQSYNPIYGTTRNPWNLERTPGGSSGGSAAALAAGFSALEAGTDIGGSIRTPAHFCGVFGHKPTWGIVPMSGHELMPGVPDPDLSVCGPLARDAADLAVALDVMAGPTGREAVGWRLELPRPGFRELSELRVAVWANEDIAPVSAETVTRVQLVADAFARLGATVSHSARPEFDIHKAQFVYQNLLTAVMSSGQPVSHIEKMRELAATLDPADMSADAITARASLMSYREWIRHDFRRERLRRAWDALFRDWDVLVCPQFAVPAIPHDHRPFAERSTLVDGEARPYMESVFWSGLVVASYLPSTCLPTGPSGEGLPIGVQIVGAPYRDHTTIACARRLADEIGGFVPPPALPIPTARANDD